MADILHFLEFIIVCAFALLALFVVLLVVVSKMPRDNPLRMILSALSHRVGATAGLMIVDPVATGLPVVGEVFDLATIALLVYYWFTFFKQLVVMVRQSPAGHAESSAHTSMTLQPPLPRQPSPPQIEHQ
jgi:hypothetical protein